MKKNMNNNSLISLISGLKNLKQAGAVDIASIKEAENALGLEFAKDYISYLESFGQIEANGIELTGISKHKSTSVIEITRRERKLGNMPEYFYVIEDLGIDGIVYSQNKDGEIVELIPHREPVIFAASLQEYIEKSQKM